MSWFKRENTELEASSEKRVRTEGLWVKCEGCRQVIWKKDLDQNWNVCPKCERHFRIDARTRLALLLDDGEKDDSFTVEDENLASTDPLKFVDVRAYSDRLRHTQSTTGLKDAAVNAESVMNGRPIIISAMKYCFIAGRLREVVGEAIMPAIERSPEKLKPLIIFSASAD